MLPDNYDLFVQHDREQERALQKLPICSCCLEIIQDEYYWDLGGEVLCEECLNDNYRKEVSV